jgi:hypothetical protein
MRRIMIQADEELLARARDEARRRRVSVAQLVRDALEKELPSHPPPPTSLGRFSSGTGDLSARAGEDEYEPEPFRSS